MNTFQYTIYDRGQGESVPEENSIETGQAYLSARGNRCRAVDLWETDMDPKPNDNYSSNVSKLRTISCQSYKPIAESKTTLIVNTTQQLEESQN